MLITQQQMKLSTDLESIELKKMLVSPYLKSNQIIGLVYTQIGFCTRIVHLKKWVLFVFKQ
jgi:hypothetical protein